MPKLAAATGTLLLFAIAALLAAACGGGDGGDTPQTAADFQRDAFKAGENSPYRTVVARVNGVDIMGQELAYNLAINAGAGTAVSDNYEEPESQPGTARSTLNSMMVVEVVYQEAVKRGLMCTDEEVREIARQQIGALAEDAPAMLEVWADNLGVSVDTLTTDEQALESYGQKCARARLRSSFLPEAELYTEQGLRQWEEFSRSLLADADVEILDPELQ